MRTIVCMKTILDPDVPARDFAVDASRREAVRGSAGLVPNVFCENALEAALRLRQAAGGTVTVVTVGAAECEETLRKGLAMTADAAVHVLRDGANVPDAAEVAGVLAAAVRHLGAFDLVCLGRESGDWGLGQTGGWLAEELGVPFIAFADRIEPVSGGVRVRRQTDNGYEVLESPLPLVVTVSNSDATLPRIPKARDVMRSYKAPVTTLPAAGLERPAVAGSPSGPLWEVVELAVRSREVHCELVGGDSLEEKIDAFASRLAAALEGA